MLHKNLHCRSRIRHQAEKKKQRVKPKTNLHFVRKFSPSLSLFQEFFERKRLQVKVKRVAQPRSPQDKSVRTISRDLLNLQTISKAYSGSLGEVTTYTAMCWVYSNMCKWKEVDYSNQ